jgi:hypothetical protein
MPKFVYMKKCVWIGMIASCCFLSVIPTQQTHAVIPIAQIIKAAVTKVIKAMDLMVQRLQNETIKLQNAQRAIENAMSKLKLKEIAEWGEKQRSLYKQYYDELWKVRTAIAYYKRVRTIMEQQVQLVGEYKRAYSLFQKDKHFTPEEIRYIYAVYTGIIEESIKNLDLIILVINSFATQMADAKRLELIEVAAANIDRNVAHLREFTNQNKMLSLQRAKDAQELRYLKQLYGLPQ